MKKNILPLTISIFIILSITTLSAFGVHGLEKIDYAGNTFLKIFQRIGYWVIAIGCTGNVIKVAASGSKERIMKIVTTSGMMAAGIYLIPWMLNVVRDIFGS